MGAVKSDEEHVDGFVLEENPQPRVSLANIDQPARVLSSFSTDKTCMLCASGLDRRPPPLAP